MAFLIGLVRRLTKEKGKGITKREAEERRLPGVAAVAIAVALRAGGLDEDKVHVCGAKERRNWSAGELIDDAIQGEKGGGMGEGREEKDVTQDGGHKRLTTPREKGHS